MEYVKHKTLSIYIWICIFIWPCIHGLLSPSNNAILTLIIMTGDIVVTLNKNRKSVYSEYYLVKGKEVDSIRGHTWLIFIICSRVLQKVCAWVALICIHNYSPIYGGVYILNRILLFYICLILDILTDGIYKRCYKKWIVSDEPISTNDAELPTFSRKQSD